MLDAKYICENLKSVIKKLETRCDDFSYLKKLPSLQERRKNLILEGDKIKEERNTISKDIGVLKSKGKNKEAEELLKKISFDKERMTQIDNELTKLEEDIKEILLKTPNIPDDSVPLGKDDNDNKVIKYYLEPKKFNFKPKGHYELFNSKYGFDFERATKVSAPRFAFYLGQFAHLERALASFMLDTHVLAGYNEILPPYLVNTASLTGSGQLPKFADQAYLSNNTEDSLWLIPTAEVPVTNYYRNEILNMSDLPKWFCAYSSCFRAEAGAAGKDTKGIIRQHQFQKVELVKFTLPEKSYDELEELTSEAEKILELLKLPYRRVCLCSGDLGFSSAKTYDLEVFMPSYSTYEKKGKEYIPTTPIYKEISSCSNDTDYQARRMNIRFKRNKDSKTEYVHMLNGSGLAIGRTVAAIIENYQNEDGSISVPEVLIPYMHTDIIK